MCIRDRLFDMDKITVDEDGKVSGVDEQLTAMQESKKFLFKTNEVQVDYTTRSGKIKSINPFAKDTLDVYKRQGFWDAIITRKL